jgi:hypothetical protein
MQVRLFQTGSEPPPSANGVVEDITTDHVPLVGDVIQVEGKNGEVVKRYRIVSRLFRTVFSSGSTEVALEVEPTETQGRAPHR